ncbi:hypothetical protein IE81DRAFT_15178 [Ceraceosorus guamensis]|uniref:NADH dehydrogenase [ubiquinone] 1 beta subcomplex subunit 9 n=1 Tax=Ceraceosorus guamensis TaxID=1522189 RepID=A0A316VT90_9BASI|nr:hypothetical protein IE81DRAFT_15178 [Ceraceosorus guamensis]PWN39633.1 hypothetical protein IE81DRAFT_15178 [Ceraceosorus guamensis]
MAFRASKLLYQASGASSGVSSSLSAQPFSAAHKSYVQGLYRRYLKNELDWVIRRDIWRDRAIEIRAEFERARHIRNPRELASVLEKAEKDLLSRAHPDPYKRKWGGIFVDQGSWCQC